MSTTVEPTQQVERSLYKAHPSMFRNKPVGFCVCLLLIPAFGLGLILLFFWWLDTLGTTLTITDSRSILRKGLLSKFTTEIFHDDIRNVQLRQTFRERMFNVGSLGISSAGQSGIEIVADGIPAPNKVKDLLYTARQRAPLPGGASAPSAPLRASVSPPSHRNTATPRATSPSKPITPDVEIAQKESAFALMAKEYGQRCIDFLAYAASFSWVSRMPDWAQPIVWGLLVSLPIVILMIMVFNMRK
jgi:hypothetical protein